MYGCVLRPPDPVRGSRHRRGPGPMALDLVVRGGGEAAPEDGPVRRGGPPGGKGSKEGTKEGRGEERRSGFWWSPKLKIEKREENEKKNRGKSVHFSQKKYKNKLCSFMVCCICMNLLSSCDNNNKNRSQTMRYCEIIYLDLKVNRSNEHMKKKSRRQSRCKWTLKPAAGISDMTKKICFGEFFAHTQLYLELSVYEGMYLSAWETKLVFDQKVGRGSVKMQARGRGIGEYQKNNNSGSKTGRTEPRARVDFRAKTIVGKD